MDLLGGVPDLGEDVSGDDLGEEGRRGGVPPGGSCLPLALSSLLSRTGSSCPQAICVLMAWGQEEPILESRELKASCMLSRIAFPIHRPLELFTFNLKRWKMYINL